MSWLKRLLGRGRHCGGDASAGDQPGPGDDTAPPAPGDEEPWEPIARAVAGVDALGGDRVQLRVWVSGTFGGQLIITVTFDRDGSGEVSVVDPGADARQLFLAGLAGEPVSAAPSRTESRAAIPAEVLAPLRQLVDATAWTLGEMSPTGTDGHTVMISVFSPTRGSHRAQGWCPRRGTRMGQLTAAAIHVASRADASVVEQPWVLDLLG